MKNSIVKEELHVYVYVDEEKGLKKKEKKKQWKGRIKKTKREEAGLRLWERKRNLQLVWESGYMRYDSMSLWGSE